MLGAVSPRESPQASVFFELGGGRSGLGVSKFTVQMEADILWQLCGHQVSFSLRDTKSDLGRKIWFFPSCFGFQWPSLCLYHGRR